jgi:hypothetical protein
MKKKKKTYHRMEIYSLLLFKQDVPRMSNILFTALDGNRQAGDRTEDPKSGESDYLPGVGVKFPGTENTNDYG